MGNLVGPLVTLAVIIGLMWAELNRLDGLDLPVVLLLAVAFSACVGGFRQGLLSAGLAWVFLCLYLFLSPLGVRERLTSWTIWTVALPTIALLIGFLHRRARERQFKPWKGDLAPFRLASESVLDQAVMLLDREGKVATWNTGAGYVFGWSAEEMHGQTLRPCCDAEEIARGAPETLLRAATERHACETELWCVRKTGARFRAKATLQALHDDQNEVAGYTVSVQDLSARQQAESVLLRRAHQQVAVAALSQAALVGTDLPVLLDHAVTFVMQTWAVDFCAIFELQPDGHALLLRAGDGWKSGLVGHLTVQASPESMMGYTLQSAEPVIVKDLSQLNRFQIPEFLKEHEVVSGLHVVIPGPQRPFGVLAVHTRSQTKFDEDELRFLQAVASVLATAQVRNAAEAENQKLAAFPQYNPNPVLEFSGDGQLTYANDAAHKMAARLQKSDPLEILPTETTDIIRASLASRQARLGLETQHEGRTISWAFYPIPDIGRVHLYAVDVTERLSLEAQLRQLQKMEAIGQLAAGVAHDFNNLLTIMQGYATRLLLRTPRDDQRNEMEQILNSTERAAALTKQLLAFSRRQKIQPRLLDLREVVTNMSEMLHRLIGENVALKVTKPETLPAVSADASMMEQVLLNLVVNARDAMPDGGELVVDTAQVEVDAAWVQRQPEARPGVFVRLKVADTGIGMDPATRAHIFEPFFTTKGPGKGTGLGLATVYGIVQQHQGWIEVESEPNQGTTFSILFPVAAGSAELAPAQTGSPDTMRGGNETILLVEDEPLLRELARAVLQDLGYQVLEASTGLEAIVLWQQQREAVDLLLTDMVMPGGLTGRDLAEKLRGEKPDLKVIFSSGYGADGAGMDFADGRGIAFLQKPYRPHMLAKMVRHCLDVA